MKLSESDQSRLLGIFEKGAERSASALAALTAMPWSIHVVSLDVGTGARFLSILSRDAREYSGAYFSSPGERYLVLFSEESGRALVSAAFGEAGGARRTAPVLEAATLAEIANVLINGLSGELADRQGMIRVLSTPTLARGRKDALYGRAFGGVPVEEAMVDVLIHISSPQLAADCTVMLRFDSLSANFLLHTDPDDLAAYLPEAFQS